MATTMIMLVGLAVAIYFSCELFVNGIEWVGRKFNLSSNAVGTVLAAIGTALPESIVTLSAVAFGTTAGQKDIGVGAAIGGPLVLSTIAYAVVGGLLAFRQRESGSAGIDGSKLTRDQRWFVLIFIGSTALGFFAFPGKAWLSLLFVAAYIAYAYQQMQLKGEGDEAELEPLRFRPYLHEPETSWVMVQIFLSLTLIFICSQIFVHRLEEISGLWGIPPQLVSLLLSPVATELPEILNAVIWIRQGKVMLALSNVSGAMMIQSTIPSALGIFFTAWLFDTYVAGAALFTVMSISFIWWSLRQRHFSPRKMSLAVLFYLAFLLWVVIRLMA